MNYYIYREYLDFRKKHKQKLPIKFWVLISPLFVYLAMIVLFEFKGNNSFLWVAAVSLIVFLIMIIVDNKKYKGNEKEKFENRKSDREELFTELKKFAVNGKDLIISLQSWLKVRIEDYEKHVKITCAVFSTITFSGLLTLWGSILPVLFEKDSKIPQDFLDVMIWVSCFVVVSFLLVLGLYSSEYYDYKNMKLFLDDLQDILDYNLYEETQEDNEQNENEDDNIELIKDDENLETENKPKTKKCKMKMGRKITIEIVKYDYTEI